MSAKRLLAVTFLLVGTNVFTYAYTRYRTTERTLSKALDATKVFLQDLEFMYGPRNVDKKDLVIPGDRQLASNRLISRVWCSGGMYFWHNDALPYYGLGVLLVSVGLLLPWVRSRESGRKPELEASIENAEGGPAQDRVR